VLGVLIAASLRPAVTDNDPAGPFGSKPEGDTTVPPEKRSAAWAPTGTKAKTNAIKTFLIAKTPEYFSLA
jgi:hypothetical protein